VENLMD